MSAADVAEMRAKLREQMREQYGEPAPCFVTFVGGRLLLDLKGFLASAAGRSAIAAMTRRRKA